MRHTQLQDALIRLRTAAASAATSAAGRSCGDRGRRLFGFRRQEPAILTTKTASSTAASSAAATGGIRSARNGRLGPQIGGQGSAAISQG